MSAGVRGGPAGLRSFAYPILLVIAGLDAAGYSLIGPVVPEIARTTDAGPATMGVLVAMFPLGIILGFPIAGRLIQRRDPERVLLVSILVVAVSSLGFAVWDGMAAYMVSRLVMGLGSGGLWMGITFATLERWPHQAYVCMSRIFAAYSAGGLVGPALGAMGGIRGPFLAYFALSVLSLAAATMLRPPGGERRPFRSDSGALGLPGFRLASASILFAVVGLGIAEGLLPLHFGERLSQAEIAGLYVAVSVVVGIAAASAARFDPWTMVVLSIVTIVAGIGLAGASVTVPLWSAGLALAGVGVGVGNTGSIGILLDAVPSERIMTAMVVWSQVGIAGYLVGPLAGGAVVEGLGFVAIGLVPLVAACVVMSVRLRVRRA